ncbi:transposable element Tcb2 transposase [Trichonephila clavipes]|nr:transposable element Tcb2 transposase [Trichonephila clavipes]
MLITTPTIEISVARATKDKISQYSNETFMLHEKNLHTNNNGDLTRNKEKVQQITEFERERIIGLREGGFSYHAIEARVQWNSSIVMRVWKQWTDEHRTTRTTGCGRWKEGSTVTSVAAKFGINKLVVLRALKAFQTTGTAVRKVGGGRSRTTTAGEDRCIILQAKRGRQQSASTIALQLCIATRRQVSRFTVARRLQKGGLFAHRLERCLPLKDRRHRSQWCREHKNWTTDQWSRVPFTDESRFSTRSDSQRVLIWREIETRFYSSNIKERHLYGGPGVLVWRGIMLNG